MSTSSLEVSIDFGEGVARSVGRLAVTSTHFAFEYSESFLANPLPISPLTLKPLRRLIQRPIGNKLWGVFEDSLPDSFGRKVLTRRMKELGIEDATALDMLAVVGRRGMGALTYAPSTDKDEAVAPVELGLLAQDTEALYRESPAKVLDALVRAAGTAGGAHPKVVVGRSRDGRLWPDAGDLPAEVTRWLIKFHGDDSAFSGMIEGALNTLAATAGIDVPRSEILESGDGRKYFSVERFDRPGSGRLHLHTFGGMAVEADFATVDYSELLGVARLLTHDIGAVEQCFRRMVFNVAVGNRDDHDKNFAFLMDSAGEWRLSPAYDITWSDPTVKREHVMLVRSKGRGILRSDCLGVADTAGIQKRVANAIVDEVLLAVGAFQAHADAVGLPGHIVETIQSEIRANVAALAAN